MNLNYQITNYLTIKVLINIFLTFNFHFCSNKIKINIIYLLSI